MVLAIVSCSDYPNLTGDDTPQVVSELRRQGVNTEVVVWDSLDVKWERFAAAILRSAWDYSHRHDEFLTWLDRISLQTQLWNPPQIVKWNTDKHYLLDLQRSGIPVLPTEWIPTGGAVDLEQLMAHRQWNTVVIKPAISANARRTVVVGRTQVGAGQAHLVKWLPERDMMVQEFELSIIDQGERSLIFIADEFNHAVVKTPASGDYRIQESFGGKARSIAPTPEEKSLAQQVLDAIGQPLLYARVDIIGSGDRLAVIEIELAEPSLYLQYVPKLVPQSVSKMMAFLEARGIDLHT